MAYVSVINFGTEVANECQSLAGRMMRCFFSPSPSGWPFMNVETDYCSCSGTCNIALQSKKCKAL